MRTSCFPFENTTKLISLIAFLATACSYSTPELRIHHEASKTDFHDAFLRLDPGPARPNHPNIVLILADDLGKTDISIYGGKKIQTPHIDQIGKSGVVFSEGYISSPICSPSRAGMLTGRYQQRFGYEYQPHDRYPHNGLESFVYDNFLDTKTWDLSRQKKFPDFEGILQQGLPPSEFTLAELLKKHGYHTGIIGKWHLGTEAHTQPNQRGFDYQYGFYEAFTLYHPDVKSDTIISQRHSDFSDKYMWKQGRGGNCALRCNNKVVEDSVYLTQRLATEAVDYIAKHKNSPFFLYVPFSAPHTPFQVPKTYFDRFPNELDHNKRVYYGMISAMDDAVGQITKAIHDQGLEENTLVIFLSDNGGATYTFATDNFPLKGGKFTNFEGGINVPFLMSWPGTLQAGTHYNEPVISLDIFQTCAELAHVTLPHDRPFDGVNLIPFLNGEKEGAPHEALFWRSNYAWAIRKGDWKLVADEMSGSKVLYHLKTDKVEKNNRYTSEPGIVEDLRSSFDAWDAQTIPPLWPRVMDFRFETADGVFYFPL
jgi:arylsulfatase A-like enzyme